MPAPLEPIRPFECTYKDCSMSFDTEKAMRNHKKHSDEHDYCSKCNEDFDSVDDYAQHKITRPEEHGLACRVCGDEFKSESGLRRHIELNHKIDQKLTCIGCQKSFYRACLFVEHLEFGHCDVISADQFQGHIVHKYLITEFLKGGPAWDRFKQKTSKFDAAQDYEDEGGVELNTDPLGGDEEIEEIEFEALKPIAPDTPRSPRFAGPYPPLPSTTGSASDFDVASTLGGMSLSGESETSTVMGSPVAAAVSADSLHSVSTREGLSAQGSSAPSTNRQLKVWGSRSGKSVSNILFPNAKPTPTPSEFSIAAHDEAMNQEHGINIMQTRFWDPMSSDWNPEYFYDSVISKYHCPFICEQTFEAASDLNDHILGDHRVTRMKCPMCLKYFKSATTLMAHCESRGAKCQINKAEDFNIFLDRLSGGFLGVEEKVRPDHRNNPKVLLTNSETGHMQFYTPPVASYLQYTVTKPPDWKEPVRPAVQIGGIPKKKTSPW